MGKCRNCGKEIGFSLTRLCRECSAETKAEIEEHNYRLDVGGNMEELKAFDQGKSTVVMTNNSMRKERIIRYAEEHGYEAHGISSDGDPEFPIETMIFKKTSIMNEWGCQYCKTVNEGKFCSNCGSPRKR
jgi:hypothetical protein